MYYMDKLNLKRTTFKITTKCTLKCELCQAFIPYLKEHKDTSLEQCCQILERYFALVDSVGTFSATGGEPFIHPQLALIMQEIFKYKEQITGNIDIVTNGTLAISDELLETLAKHKDKARVIISNYGPQLSRKFEELKNKLTQNDILFRVEEYFDEKNLKYGGWIDYRDHSLKHKTEEEIIEQASHCFWRQGRYYEINFGELHPCARSFYRMKEGIIKKDENQFISLIDSKNSIEEDREKLRKIDNLIYLNSCAYCFGNTKNVKRHKPAVQLKT